MNPAYKDNIPKIVKRLSLYLTLIMFVKIAGYFSVIEDRGITQVYKIITRMGMTGVIFLIYRKLIGVGCQPLFKAVNILPLLLYIAYLVLGLASLAWSTKPGYSALQWVMVFESFVFTVLFINVLLLVRKYFPDYAINLSNTFNYAIFPIMLIFLIGSFVDPDTFYRGMRGGEEKRLGGFLMNPNELGMLSSIGAAMAYLEFSFKRKRILAIITLIVAVVVLWLTSSRSSLIGFLAIMGILILQSENKNLKIAMLVGGLLAAPIAIKEIIFKEGGGVEEVMSMTGRLPFWTALLNEGIVREPFFGFGFMRINYTDTFQGLNTYPGRMTHNTFMQVLMNLGFVGLFIALWQLITAIRNYFIDKISPYRSFFIALFIPVIINSFTEFGIFGESNYGILFYQFLFLLFVQQIREPKSFFEKLAYEKFKRKYPD